MDKIILALLFFQSKTLYEIREKFSGNLNLMYSSSMGSIQAAIKKLSRGELIACDEKVENGRYKKLYSITEKGKKELNAWINSPFKEAQNRNPELAKLYFMGLSDPNRRSERILEYISSLEKYHAALQTVYEEGLSLNPPEELRDLFRFQLLTVKFGLDTSKYEIWWFKKLIADMENGEIMFTEKK